MREQKTFKTEGIILKRNNYGEADKIITVYTKYHGKIRAIAKGVRKLTSRKAGSLELFNHTVLFIVKGKNLDIVTEAQGINLFKSWRKSLNKVGLAYYFCELVDKLTPDNQPNQIVFNLLEEYFKTMNLKDNFSLVREFEEKLLNELGFGVPEVFAKTPGSLRVYIESIIEKKLNSPKILKQL
ncbi:MAG: DNA repair protein RecO [Candidatus Shapirobacteria bacterium]|nr:DNA repair protein RecO [Candidatus Shapirobacteria bacterium]